MTPVIPCSSGSVTLLTKATFSQRKQVHFTKYNVPRRFLRIPFSNQIFFLPQSISLKPLQRYFGNSESNHSSKAQFLAAVGADIAIEEPNSAISDEQADTVGETEIDESSVVPTTQSKRSRPARRSDMPSVKNEELVPGASFTGKVRSIQAFGAFVDFGAFTDGLVHVSKLSDEFVKDVASIVSVGQEVKVRILEANMESGRISLTMRDGDDPSKPQQRKDASSIFDTDKPRTGRKNATRSNQKSNGPQKISKFVKGQILDGTVKNLTRSGAYISLPEGEEGFLALAEESEGFGNILGSSSLQIGQDVSVRVLRLSRGQVTLTMKKEEDVEAINMKLNQGVVHTATNPFLLAFLKNKDIAAFLDEREKAPTVVSSKQLEEKIIEEPASIPASVDPAMEATIIEASDLVIPDVSLTKTEEHTSSEVNTDDDPSLASLISQETELPLESVIPESSISIAIEPNEAAILDDDNTGSTANSAEDATSEADSGKEASPANGVTHEGEISAETLISEGNGSVPESVTDVALTTDGPDESNTEFELSEQVHDVNLSSESIGSEEVVGTTQIIDETVENDAKLGQTDDAVSNGQSIPTKENSPIASVSPALVKQLRDETGAGMMDCKKALGETGGDIIKAQEFLRKKGLASADKKASRATTEGRIGSYVHDNRIGVLIEVNCETDFVSRGDIFKELVDDLAMQVAACPQVKYLVTEDVPEEFVTKEREIEMQKEDLLTKPEQMRSKIVDARIRKRLEEFALLEQPYIKNDKMVVKDLVKQTIATIGENIKVKRFVRYNLGEGLQKKSEDFAAEIAAQTASKEPPSVPKEQPSEAEATIEKTPAVAISAALVKQLREDTGAGMMDCKKALSETSGDLEKAQEYLRKKGLSSADKKSSRLASEGRISTYIHDSRIGILIEVNCETDFVARNERFKELVDDLAMQVVACPQVEFVSMEEIPESVLRKEKEIEMQREDLQSKPKNIREKIVEGRVSKRLGELALLEQSFIKDDSVLVKDLVKQAVAALGENIRVRRFVRFNLGE